MIKSIHIQNFKSINDLKLDLGSFNVLIGENGCGKSNILEGIAFGAAASADKLDPEFLGSRGVRVTNPEFMFSAFQKKKANSKIEICFDIYDYMFDSADYILSNTEMKPNTWVDETRYADWMISKNIMSMTFPDSNPNLDEQTQKSRDIKNMKSRFEKLTKVLNSFKKTDESFKRADEMLKEIATINLEDFVGGFRDRLANTKYQNKTISDFITYSPEESSLRKFEDSTQIYPIGIKGAGLF